ncbi:MAG: hypothetical protein ACK5LS_07600 [Propioniciclava sp.]
MAILHSRDDERGQALSSFIAVVLAALFLTAGLVIDGGAQSAASRDAHTAAREAARAAVDASAASQAAGGTIDVGQATAAGRQLLAERGVTGTIVITGGTVQVTTTTSVDTLFLGLIGITTLSARGEARAELFGG